MENVRVKKANCTLAEAAKAKLAKGHTSQMSATENSVIGLVRNKPNIALKTNVDNSISTFENSRQNKQNLSEIIKNSDNSHGIKTTQFHHQMIKTVSEAPSSVHGDSFHTEKNDIQVMGQVFHQLADKPNPISSRIHEPSGNVYRNRKSTCSDDGYSVAEKASIFKFGYVKKDQNRVPDSSGPMFENILVNRVQIPSCSNSEIEADEQARTQKDKIYIENAQNSFSCSKKNKEISVIAAKTKEFMQNEQESRMLILKKISNLQKMNFAQEMIVSGQAVQTRDGQHKQRPSRQCTEAQISRKTSLQQN